jgi:hypothetical protein
MAKSCRNLIIAAVMALALPLSGALASPASAAVAGESLLYVQTTSGGTLSHVRGTRRFRLVFDGVGAGVARFADRPHREAGQEKVRRFVGQWRARGFGDNPPAAALVLDDAPSTRDVILLTLRRPRYDARRARLSYDAVALSGAADPALARFESRRDEARSMRFGHASLFVDDGAALRYLQLQLLFSNIAPASSLSLALDAGSGISFTTGPPQSATPGLGVDSIAGSTLPLSRFAVGAQRLEITTAAGSGYSTVSASVVLALPENGPSSVRTTIVAPGDVIVQAGIAGGKLTPLPIGEGALTLG